MDKNPEEFLLGVCGVQAGDPPATKRVFAGTFLRLFPDASVARGYWAAQVCSRERGWLTDVLSSGEEPHALVERPICRITSTRRLFVTSERNIADSITALTERGSSQSRV